MSSWERPDRSRISLMTGMRISTSLRLSSRRTEGDWATATTATSLIGPPSAAPLREARCAHWSCAPPLRFGARSKVMPIGLVVGVGFAGGPPVPDAVHGGTELVGPDRLDSQAHAYLV